MGDTWPTWDACVLALMGRAEPRPVPGTRSYQLLVSPAFRMPACVEIEETDDCVAMAPVILQDRGSLQTLGEVFFRQGSVRPVPAEVVKGTCWEDVLLLPPEQEACFRRLCDDADPWGLQDSYDEYTRDGISLMLRPGRSRTVHMSNPSRECSPGNHRWATSILDLVAACCHDGPYAAYLATLRPDLAPW